MASPSEATELINTILESFYEKSEDGNSSRDAAIDLLTDFYHWCDANLQGIAPSLQRDQLHRMALRHHDAEVAFLSGCGIGDDVASGDRLWFKRSHERRVFRYLNKKGESK
tara:strand:+ start:4935 stop:5267 length:333 start_codon:yes stop_codon:yes gene_type:complete